MDKQRGIELLNEASKVYSRGGMHGFEQWVQFYQGENDDKQYLLIVRRIVLDINKRTRLYSLDNIVIQEILEQSEDFF